MMKSVTLSSSTLQVYDEWERPAQGSPLLAHSDREEAPKIDWSNELKALRTQLDDLKAKEACRDREILALRKQVFRAEQENTLLRKDRAVAPAQKAPLNEFMGSALDALHHCHEDSLREIYDILFQLQPKEPEMDDGFLVVEPQEDPAELLKRLQKIIESLGITDPIAFLEKLSPEDPEFFDFVVVDPGEESIGNGEPADTSKKWTFWRAFQKGRDIYGGVSAVMTVAPVVAMFIGNPWIAIGIQLVRLGGLPFRFFSR